MDANRATNLLDELEKHPWLSALGQPIDPPRDVEIIGRQVRLVRVSTMEAGDRVLAWLQSKAHSDAFLDALNEMTRLLGYDSIGPRNQLSQEIRPRVTELVDRMFHDAGNIEPAVVQVKSRIPAAIILMCHEDLFFDESKARGYQFLGFNQAFWLMQGHLPCGWLGPYPKGELVVY